MNLQSSHTKILTKLWLYPLTTLLLMMLAVGLLCVIGSDTRGNLLLTELVLGIMILVFGVGSIINLIKGMTLYIKHKESMIAKRLVSALVLIGIVIAIPTLRAIRNHMHLDTLKRHNRAVEDIRHIKWSLEAFMAEHGAYPSGDQGLETLHNSGFSDTFFIDPWGRPYDYRLEESSESNGHQIPHVWSFGKDGLSGTDDDIDANSPRRHIPYYHYPAP